MNTSSEIIKKEIDDLIIEGQAVSDNAVKLMIGKNYKEGDPLKHVGDQIRTSYQNWYAKALPVITTLAPERRDEFVEQYKVEKRKDLSVLNYAIYDYLSGYGAPLTKRNPATYEMEEAFDPSNLFVGRFRLQRAILESIKAKIDVAITDIEGFLQASLFDSELDAAHELLSKGHLRAAGTLAGVSLEAHLKNICAKHSVGSAKQKTSIANFNDALKKAKVIDVPTWRFIQHLGDLRNLCAHSSERNPTKPEVTDLINGVKKITKTLF